MIKKASKKRIVLAVAAVMALGVFGLTACNLGDLDDYKEAAKFEIQAHADAKLQQNGYTEDGKAAIAQAVTEGKQAVERAKTKPQVDTAVTTAKNEINAVLTEEQEVSDFILTISVDKVTLLQGEDFKVSVKLKNNSGENVEIAFGYTHPLAESLSASIPLFQPHIEGWRYLGEPSNIMPGDANFATIVDGEKISSTFEVGSRGRTPDFNEAPLSKGNHELKFRATFSLNWGAENQQEIIIWSNIVLLTVQ